MSSRSKIQMMGDFMEGLNTMTDAAGQMVHHMPDNGMKWIAIRDMLHLIRDAAEKQNPQLRGQV